MFLVSLRFDENQIMIDNIQNFILSYQVIRLQETRIDDDNNFIAITDQVQLNFTPAMSQEYQTELGSNWQIKAHFEKPLYSFIAKIKNVTHVYRQLKLMDCRQSR